MSEESPRDDGIVGEPAGGERLGGGRGSPLDELEHWLEIDRKRSRRAAASDGSESASEEAGDGERPPPAEVGSGDGALDGVVAEAAPVEALAKVDSSPSLLEALAAIDLRAGDADTGAADAGERAPGERIDGERVVVFSLAGARYALPIDRVAEIGGAPVITWVPNVPAWIRGVTNLRGDILAVLDLAAFLAEDQAASGTGGRLLVLRAQHDNRLAGLLVQHVLGIRPLAAGGLRPPTAGIEGRITSFLLGCAEIDDRVVSLLDLDPLLAALESGREAAG